MIRAPGRATSRSDTLLFLACLLLSIVAIALPDRWSQQVAAGLRDTVLSPLLWIQRQAAEGRTSRSRFQAVQAERDSVALASQSVAALTAENARLRALLELRARTVSSSVPAEVLHQSAPTDGRTLLLGVGAASGVRTGDPVVSPEGLLGVLVSVGVRTSVAMTWAHPDFRVSAVTEDGSALGIVAPSSNTDASETFLEFRGVAYRDTVATGALVMTSGLGGVYPKGVPIGRVAGVRREELGYERVYRLAPLANPGHVAHALIVRTPAPAAVP
ncbi:MAG TPA: rod shape-determining protein MreC [Gemmatimonadales bacterium]|jgi:rod shape-determining protein MreC|nr:rod shape-determining protein MreC [Gemmatimonadales bacterium]